MNRTYFGEGSSGAMVFSLGANGGWPTAHFRRIVQEPDLPWRRSAIEQLNALVALERGWDGYRAGPVSFETANFALRMLDSACGFDAPCPQIVPGSDGDLQIEWHLLKGDIELHVAGPLRVSASFTTNGVVENIEMTNDFTIVAQWLAALADHELAATAAA